MPNVIVNGQVMSAEEAARNSATSAADQWNNGPLAGSSEYTQWAGDNPQAWQTYMNLFSQDRAMDFNSAEAAKQREWNAHDIERKVADLKAAGLNPWLAINGGAFGGSPSSSAASIGSTNIAGQHFSENNTFRGREMSFAKNIIGASSDSYKLLGKVLGDIVALFA